MVLEIMMSSCAQETPLIVVLPIGFVTSTITFAHESALIYSNKLSPFTVSATEVESQPVVISPSNGLSIG
jgi:hypothetical protein